MGFMRALWRLFRVTLHFLQGLYIVHRRFPTMHEQQRQQAIRDWSGRFIRMLGVHLQVLGEPPAGGPLLVVANHQSWLDIFVMNASRPCRFVSKSDVMHWPLIGRLAIDAGTLFIERRNRRDALRVVRLMADHLQAGDVIAVFPEGGTSEGKGVMYFHANLLQAAVQAHHPVQPAGVIYLRGRGQAQSDQAPRHPAPIYVGKTTLIASLWRVASATDLQATVHWGEADTAMGRDRHTWAAALRLSVAQLSDLPPLERDA
jgi:1-acyl-sn-glycerol-3-phosphate acyltransferase